MLVPSPSPGRNPAGGAACRRAQPVEGLYLGAGAGLNFVPDLNDQGVRLRTRDPGFAGVLSLGWGFGNGWRAEIEGNYRDR